MVKMAPDIIAWTKWLMDKIADCQKSLSQNSTCTKIARLKNSYIVKECNPNCSPKKIVELGFKLLKSLQMKVQKHFYMNHLLGFTGCSASIFNPLLYRCTKIEWL